MEDQQREPQDLTGADPEGLDAAGRSETGHPAAEAPTADRPSRRLDTWLCTAVAAAAVLFVGSAAFAAAASQPYLADRVTAANKMKVARTAAAAVTTLWTYTPDTIDTLPDRAGQYLSGDFDAQYRKFLEAAIMPNKQARVTDKTTVVGVAVESLNAPDAVALVLTNTTATSPLTKSIPSLKYVGYRLAMKQRGSRWLVTKMATISFFDLTPQI
ncbi:mammalian cell entry protein [Mycobacterium sp. SM1]|uniref:mammalian cell entry protein n=1 Tax=Mycobacterium sp. SM1 TaxID=2816243 RepID=UPI001BCEC644|nr:mammalian cell entry protein [Mycobacterium sp. SM1]MBS4727942.1 mammalian cell entry protein [Mycobacterium sp. SM1]